MTYLSGEHAPIESQVTRNIDELDVRGHLLAHDNMDEVARDKVGSGEGRLHAIAEDGDVVGEHILYRSHDARRRKVLPRIEGRLKKNDDEKDDGKGEVRRLWVRVPQRFPTESHSAIR